MHREVLRFHAMGSPCAVHVYAEIPEAARALARRAVDEVDRLEAKYTRYRDDSLTSRVNRSAGDPSGVVVDEETAGLLDYAQTVHRESDGLFDITSGILRRAWDFKSGRLPEPAEIEALLDRVGWQHVRWEAPHIVLPREGMQVDFGGYVKEYAADRAAGLLRDAGIRHGLVDLGGDLAVVGSHPDGTPWRIGVRDPHQPQRPVATVALLAGAIASSGDYERFMFVEGKRYGHILDPRTGWPVESFAAVSVLADQCLVAGSASTVAMLRGETDGARWLEELGLPNLRVSRDGELAGNLARREMAA